MRRVMRPLAVFGIAGGVSMAAGLQLMVGGAHGGDRPGDFGASAFFAGYDLTKLELLSPTLYHVEESYVEPARIDWERMYVSALEAVEHRVPVCMFTREPGGDRLALEVGEHRTVLEVAPITTRRQLQDELKRVAALLKTHLDEDDVLVDGKEPSAEPFADIEYALINGILGTLDPHSILLPPDDAREMDVENQGEFGGLGITIVEREGRLTIEYPLPDTPAERAGLQPDDHIVRIDGESTINMSLEDAVTRLRGPVDAAVVLEVARDVLPEPKAIEVVRELISIHPVKGSLLDGSVGYISIKGFHEQVERDLHDELTRLTRETRGLRGLVLDLRGNPGGFLNQAVKVSDTFLDSKVDIVSTVDGNGNHTDIERATSGAQPQYPIVVLVDANSASASEIVAGALRNNERAVIVGERTFGKGSVQNLHTFYDDSKLKLTISKYLTPGDHSIQSLGIPADIELLPSVIPEDEATVVRLFHRERVRREADLDKSLAQVEFDLEEPSYSVRYVVPQAPERRTGPPEPTHDYEVQFARDIILATGPSGWRKSDVLQAAAGTVAEYRKQGEAQLVAAFAERGIDWNYGSPAPREGTLPLDVRFDLGEDGVLTVGKEELIAVEITSTAAVPMHRVVAVATDNSVLEGREFYFGRLEPGETRRFEHRVNLVDGYPTERTPVAFTFRDSGVEPLGEHVAELAVEGRPLPSYTWSWHLSDAPGDGDGILEVGEVVAIDLTVANVGDGRSGEPFARIKNRSRKALDILRGTVEPGRMLDASGQACRVLEPGVDAGAVMGDPDDPRVHRGDPPRYAEGCRRALDPGETWTGTFEVELKGTPANGAYELDLTLGDSTAYDHASIVRAGFYPYFSQRESIVVLPGQSVASSETRRPPVVQITREPGAVTRGARVSVSGVVEDDSGIAHVMVFAGDDKVFFEGSGPTSSRMNVPFTADVELEPGVNLVTVLATDDQGLKSSRSVVTYYASTELAHASVLMTEEAPELVPGSP